jgi:hypothetical protein
VTTLLDIHMQHPQPQDMMALASCSAALVQVHPACAAAVGARLMCCTAELAEQLMSRGPLEFGAVLWAAAYSLQAGNAECSAPPEHYGDQWVSDQHGNLLPQNVSGMRGCCISLMSTLEGSMQLLHTLHCLLSIQAAPGQPHLWSGVVGQVVDMLWAAVLAWTPPTYSSTDAQTQQLLLDAAEVLWAVVTHPSAHRDTRSSDVAGRMLAALQQDSRDGQDGDSRRQVLLQAYTAVVAAR